MSNVSDHSGWMFYLWFWGDKRPWGKRLRELQKPSDVVKRVIGISERIAPGHEALWAFVRGCLIGMEGVLDLEGREVVKGEVIRYEKKLHEENRLTVGMEKDKMALARLSRYIDLVKGIS
jgi:hypothetical protein